MKRILKFGSKRIPYNLEFAQRKSLGISVSPEMEVLVRAPIGAPKEKIDFLLRRRAPWILRQQEFFLGFYPKQPPKKFVSGESHLYLGRQYLLRVRKGKKERVTLSGRHLQVVCRDKGRARHVLKVWYLRQAKLKISLIAAESIERFRRHGVEPQAVLIRPMTKRWGSCTAKGKIILNTDLIKAPRGCIRYVVVHELCHLVHRNHTSRFLELQSREMPGWERWKDKLEKSLA